MLKLKIQKLDDSYKYLIIFLVLVSIILFVEYKLNSALIDGQSKNQSITNHFLNNFSMTETDSYGKISWNLKGERLEKYPRSDRSEVFKPTMRIFSDDETFWDVKAEHALDPDSLFKSIFLTGNVIFEKTDMNNNNEIIIETTSAIIYPESEKVETNVFAKIITPDSITTGDGVIADIKNGSVEILSNAKRVSYTSDKSEQISGDRMQYDLDKKTWTVSKHKDDDKKNIKDRVTTILKTKKKLKND